MVGRILTRSTKCIRVFCAVTFLKKKGIGFMGIQLRCASRLAALVFIGVGIVSIDAVAEPLDNIVITPHLGYVTAENYKRFYGQMVENVRAWLDGKPVRVIPAK